MSAMAFNTRPIKCFNWPQLTLGFILVTLINFTSYAQNQSSKRDQPVEDQSPQKPAQETQIKDIKKVSKIALVVLDKNCPNIVEPYDLKGNALAVGKFIATETAKIAFKWLTDKIPGTSKENAMNDVAVSARLGAKQLNWLPMEAEVLYGAKSHETETNVLERTSKLGEKYYPMADELLKNILSTITVKHEYNFQLFILKNDTRNAIARPGGYLYLDKGLLESPEMLPKAHFALAHEISHVLQRHETRELQNVVVDSMTSTKQLLDAMRMASKNPAALLENVKVGKDIFSQHHSDQELQSDSCAVRLLSRVLPERRELANTVNVFLKDLPPPEPVAPRVAPQDDAGKLAGLGHDIVDTPLKRHPSTTERTANLQSIYQEITKTDSQ